MLINDYRNLVYVVALKLAILAGQGQKKVNHAAAVAGLAAKAFFVVVIVKYSGNRRHAVKLRYIALALGLTLEANAQETPDVHRSVPRGVESRVAAASMWQINGGNGRCQSRGTPALDISAPSHGTVRFAQGDVGIPEGSGCSNSVYGVVVLYQPAPVSLGRINSPITGCAMRWR
jgi:hypothetical protein